MTAQTTETPAPALVLGDMGFQTIPDGLTEPELIAYRVARHAPAHKAGMSALRSYLRKTGQTARLEEIRDPLAPVKAAGKAKTSRKAAKPSDVLAAGIESGRVVIIDATPAARILGEPDPAPVEPAEPTTVPDPLPAQTWAARKQSRRELAAAMRAAGIKPAGEAWERAKSGTPLAELVQS